LGKDYIEVCPQLLWLINFRNIYRQIIISLQPSLKTQKGLAMFFNVWQCLSAKVRILKNTNLMLAVT
jgi:hypothetical protein